MNTDNLKKSYRWVLLRHTGAPDDLKGIHFDLLFEDNDFCRTWRLKDIPQLDGPYVDSVEISPHKLYWLDINQKVISGNRGVATRIKKGVYMNSLPSYKTPFITLFLMWGDVESYLVIDKKGCRIFSKK